MPNSKGKSTASRTITSRVVNNGRNREGRAEKKLENLRRKLQSRAGHESNAPVAESRMFIGRQPQQARYPYSGTVKIASVPIEVAKSAAGIILSREVSPQTFAGDAVRNLSGAFAKFRFKTLDFEVRPLVSTAASGGYICAYLPDATTDLPSESITELSNMLLSNQWCGSAAIWEEISSRTTGGLRPIRFPSDLCFYTSRTEQAITDQSLVTSQGKFVVALVGPVTGVGGDTATFTIEVLCHYSFELWEPQARPESAAAQEPSIRLDPPIQPPAYLITADGYLSSAFAANADYLKAISAEMAVYTDYFYVIEPRLPSGISSDTEPVQYAWTSQANKGNGIYVSSSMNNAITNGGKSVGNAASFNGDYTLYPVPNVGPPSLSENFRRPELARALSELTLESADN